MQPDRDAAGAPAGYARVPAPTQDPPSAGAPVNGGRPAPRPRPGVEGPVGLTRMSRWLLERGLDAGSEPVRFAADAEHRIVTVTLAEVDHVVAWGQRFEAARPARLPADKYVGQVVQTELFRDGWTIVFRCVEVPA